MHIIGTGLSGLVGSRVVELLSSTYTFEDLSRKTGVDIQDKQLVLEHIKHSSAPVVVHMAAYTDVDAAEREKEKMQESLSWKINVEGTRNIIAACEETRKKLIYISTDMIFPGTKPIGEKYVETDAPNPVGWYAQTKYEAEKLVQRATVPWDIVRIAYPYRAWYEKKEYVRIFLSLLQEGKTIKAVTDHYFTPTFIDDISSALHLLIEKNSLGIFHVVGTEVVSPYECVLRITENWHFDSSLVEKITRAEYFKDRAPRAFNLALQNDKIKKLGFIPKNFTEGLIAIKNQL